MKLCLLFACALVACAPARSQDASSADVVELGAYELAYPFPSPDGNRVVLQGNFDGRWQLYFLEQASGVLTRAHTSGSDDIQPSFSPDGGQIAFASNRTGNGDIYVLDLATSKARLLAPHPGKDGHPRWSADGTWIVFNRTFDPLDVDGDMDAAIMRVRTDGNDLETLSDTANIETFASFSPDARWIALVEWFPGPSGEANGDIVVVNLENGARRNLTNSPEFDGYPHWGASGKWLYFSSYRPRAEGGGGFIQTRINVGTGERQKLAGAVELVGMRGVPDAREETIFFNRPGGSGRTLLFSTPLTDQQ